MALQIKQIIPSDFTTIYYIRSWVDDPNTLGYKKTKTEIIDSLLELPNNFFFEEVPCLCLALVERGSQQFVTPMDFDEEAGCLLPIDPEKQEDYVCVAKEEPDLSSFKLEIINRIKNSNE